MVLIQQTAERIREVLKKNPQGLSITDIVREVGVNRNTAGRYLEKLLLSGQVEMRHFGMAKIYSLANRVPVSAVLSISSELILQLDSSTRIVFINDAFARFLTAPINELTGKNIEYSPLVTAFDDLFPDFLARVKTGLEGIEWQGELGPARGGVIFSCRIAPTALDHGQKGVSVILEDITDRKRADEALRESEEKFRRIFEDGPLGMTLIDCNFRFSLVNRTFCEMLGYTGDELAGKSFADVTHPAHILRNKEKMRLLHTGKIPLIRDEKQYLRKDGSVLWASVTVTPLRDRKNRVTSSISIVEDITDRKQAEMQLRESEQKFREFADFLPQSVWACDLSGNLIFANRGSFSMYRYNPDDFERNLTIWQVISPGDRSIISALIAEALSKPIDQFPATVEYTALRKDGSTFPIKTYVAPVISDGVITGLRGIGIDMTDQKRTEEALQESEDRFRRVFEDGPLGMVIVDSDHRFVSVNRMCCEMFGYSEQDLLGKTIEKVTHPDHNDQDAAEMQKLYAGTISRYRTRKRYIRKDGSVIWGSLTVSPLRDRTGKIVSTMGLVEEIADQSETGVKEGS